MREIEQAQLSQIVAEMPRWQRAMALGGEKEVAVYLDLKSPHAYLAVRPTLELAVDFRVRLNFLPYTLSYTTLGVSKSVDADMQRKPVDAAADRKARMYYTTARQYAALQGLPFRTPYRLLDSELANRCFLFARTQHLEVPFVMRVFLEGWGAAGGSTNSSHLPGCGQPCRRSAQTSQASSRSSGPAEQPASNSAFTPPRLKRVAAWASPTTCSTTARKAVNWGCSGVNIWR